MCTCEYFYIYYDDTFEAPDSSQHPLDFLCCECETWNFDMEEKDGCLAIEMRCHECGHTLCGLCDVEGEDELVWDWWEATDY